MNRNPNRIPQAILIVVALVGIFIVAPHFQGEQNDRYIPLSGGSYTGKVTIGDTSLYNEWRSYSVDYVNYLLSKGWKLSDIVFVYPPSWISFSDTSLRYDTSFCGGLIWSNYDPIKSTSFGSIKFAGATVLTNEIVDTTGNYIKDTYKYTRTIAYYDSLQTDTQHKIPESNPREKL